MIKLQTLILMLCLTFSGALCYSRDLAKTNKAEGAPITIKMKAGHSGDDRSSTISASIDGHSLSVVFTENLGQVSIEVSYASGGEVETSSIYTPSGVIIYIPYSGSYVVTFTLSNGDEYYGEFEVTE